MLQYRRLNQKIWTKSNQNCFFSWCFVRRFLEQTRKCSTVSNANTTTKKKKKYTETLNLPKSQFPMKHSRTLEKEIAKNYPFEKLYNIHLDNEPKTRQYVLHDGPPYANGEAHFGHAINKILKDIFVKRNYLQNGTKVFFVPGWDCHGLPIELKALQNKDHNLQVTSKLLTPLEIRSKARQLATSAIELQKSSFKEWNISADWSHPYHTYDICYIEQQLRTFYRMFEDRLVFRDYMPVYWSPSTGTALAEAELQYNPKHISKSAYVRYPIIIVDGTSNELFSKLLRKPTSQKDFEISALIWTTTPWTLLANEAIAYSDKLDYRLVSIDGNSGASGTSRNQLYLIASELIPELSKKFNIEIESESLSGDVLSKLQYRDPLSGQLRPFLASSNITSTKGTGLVHTAPNHGYDDYKLIQRYSELFRNSKKPCIVNRNGELRTSMGNISIIDDNRASKFVLEQFGQNILLSEDYPHSYPYDWRTGKPVIVRPSSQWFLNVDLIREDCLRALNQVRIIPERLRKDLVYQLNSRPNWCISRQRKWGVPIPVFYHRANSLRNQTNEEFEEEEEESSPILNSEMFHSVLDQFKKHGTCDVWWQYPPEKLLENCSNWNNNKNPNDLRKGEDIFDIWFDSGCSWQSVLPESTGQIADLCLEGVDQIRGWFQSSLITSVAMRRGMDGDKNPQAPYRTLFIHGFALDRDGKKMSKSIGNVIDPMDIVDGRNLGKLIKTAEISVKKSKKAGGECGVDGLRFWIAQHSCHHGDVHVDVNQFETDIVSLLNRIRNTFRFIIGYVGTEEEKGNPPKFLLKPNDYYRMNLLDKHLLHRLFIYNQQTNQNYLDHSLGDVIESSIHHFLFEVSTFYLSRIKDRLYCEPRDSMEYRSILTTLWYVYHTVGYQLAPILPHIITEANQYIPLERMGVFDGTNFMEPSLLSLNKSQEDVLDCFVTKILFPENLVESSEDFTERMSLIDSIIEVLNRKQIRLNEFDLHLVPTDPKLLSTLKFFQNVPSSTNSELCEVFQVASVTYYDVSDQRIPDWIQFEESRIVAKVPDEEEKEIKEEANCPALDSYPESVPSQFRYGLVPSERSVCDRCRRYTAPEPNELCLRCKERLSQWK